MRIASLSIVCGLLALACAAGAAAQDAKRVNPDAKAIADFQEELNEYVELRSKLERTLPDLPDDASAAAIDQRKRALAALIQKARRGAKQGDIFESDVRPVLRRLLRAAFSGPDAVRLKAAITDENPGKIVRLEANRRYPDTIPLSNMPPQILKALPPLPEGIEYRFIGAHLILLDAHAHIIADFLIGAIPR